jgi:hypothetical protein
MIYNEFYLSTEFGLGLNIFLLDSMAVINFLYKYCHEDVIIMLSNNSLFTSRMAQYI